MNRIKLTAIVFFMLVSFSASAQVTQQWVKRYASPTNSNDIPKKVVVDKNTGDVYVGGVSVMPNGFNDIVVIKYNAQGVQQWINTYNGTGGMADEISDMVFDNTGCVNLTGSSSGLGSMMDYITIKYNSAGNLLWEKRYSMSGNSMDYAKRLSVTPTGEVFVTGNSHRLSPSGELLPGDIVTIKYAANGNEEWVKVNSPDDDAEEIPYSMLIDGGRFIYITGYSQRAGLDKDFLVFKYDETGRLVWNSRLAVRDGGISNKILLDEVNRKLFLVGSMGADQFIMAVYNTDGNLELVKDLDLSFNKFTDAELTTTGNIYICGNSIYNGSQDFATAMYKPNGDLHWIDYYNGTGSGTDDTRDITTDDDGNAYVTGSSQAVDMPDQYATIKYNKDGAKLWEARYWFPRAMHHIPVSVALNGNGDVHVTGYSQGSPGSFDFATIKYKQVQVSPRPVTEVPSGFELSQNYPNPFNPVTNISFNLPANTNFRLTLYDMLGNEVAIIAEGYKQAGSYEAEFNASHLASGTYFYKLSAGEFTAVKKMILIK